MASAVLQIIVTPLTEIAKLLFTPLKRQVGYLVKYHKNVNDLENEKESLARKIDSTGNAINEARRRGEAVNEEMEHWLKEVKKTMSDVENFLISSSSKEEGSRNSRSCCTNLRKRYVSSKTAAKFLKNIDKQKGEVQHVPVSQPAPPPSIEMIPTDDFEAFETTRVAMEKITAALCVDSNKVVGVFGMGGVGKTSLITQVAKHVKNMNLFVDVVIAKVSWNPDLIKIQSVIVEGLGMRLAEKTESNICLRLAERLKQGTPTLIILDDVWERIELSQIGIPSGNDESKCKVVITTRNQDVCSQMFCNDSVEVNALSQQDSWNLFKKVSGYTDESIDLSDVAKEVAKQCGGLPIALVTVGRLLRNKEPRVWYDAAYELRNSRPLNIQGMHDKIFACLKLSFDQFQNEESKLLYLYCSLFPDDYDVQIEHLLRYGFGDGLFLDVETVDDARNRTHSIISNLKSSCLLLNGNKRECVKMHDVYRDLAVAIAMTDDYSFMVKASSGFKEWPEKLRLEFVLRMSLIDNQFIEFSGQRQYPELLLLLLQNNMTLKHISDDFFAGMKSLNVLDLSNIPNMVALPLSLSCLTNLKTLCVENNNLKDGSALGGLISLEILSLRKSSFLVFPEEIKGLTNLRLLDLTDTQGDAIPAGVISNLDNLEELYLESSYSGWLIEEVDSQGKASLSEVFCLKNLSILHIDIGKHDCLTREFLDIQSRLRKFRIHVGDRVHWKSTHDKSFCVNIQDRPGAPRQSTEWVKRFLQITQHLSIVRWKNLSCLEQLQSGAFHSMKHLHIQECGLHSCLSATLFERLRNLQTLQVFSCSQLNTIFFYNKNQTSNVLPRLATIHIQDAPALTSIWRGAAPSVCFRSLKHIVVEHCKQIKSVFPFVIATQLNQLQHLEISNCEEIEALICNVAPEISNNLQSGQRSPSEADVEQRTAETGTLFPQLQTLKLMHLKKLRSLSEPWFLLDLPALQNLTVLGCPCLKKLPIGSKVLENLPEIRAERRWYDMLEFENDDRKLLLQNCFTDITT